MSGPKVVHIITVEEVQAICRRLMAQVEAENTGLMRFARRLGVLDASLQDSASIRSRQLAEMFDGRRWLDLQKLAADLLSYFPAERGRLEAVVLKKAEALRTRRRRLADSARTLSIAIKAAGTDVPAALRAVTTLVACASEAELAQMETTVGAALALVPNHAATRPEAAEADKLATRLKEPVPLVSLAEWAANRVRVPTPSERRLDTLMAEVDAFAPELVTEFTVRIAAALGEEVPSRRALLTDSLVLDISGHVARLRKREAAERAFAEADALLRTSESKETHALLQAVEASRRSEEFDSAQAQLTEAKILLEAETKTVAAAARRRAVLGALSTMGYEVRDTMERTWLQDGRVIVRKPDGSDYGIEIGSPAEGSRMQVRLVGSDRPTAPRSASRDADQETIWCGDFGRLREQLASMGDELVLERALGPGEQAVKTATLPERQATIDDVIRSRPKSHESR